MTKYLIVNADDFGLSLGVNAGIARAHEVGVLTSASLMARCGSVDDAVAYALDHPRLSLGLHVDLGEWAFRKGEWAPIYQRVHVDDEGAVTDEVAAQLALFHELVGRNPTHLDSHQHVHRREPVRSVLRRAAKLLGVPLREYTSGIGYSGQFYGQTTEGEPLPELISVHGLLRILATLPDGITELSCHPGSDGVANTTYRDERGVELATLCDSSVISALNTLGIQLCSFQSPVVEALTA